MTEEEYEKAMAAYERMMDYVKECMEEGICPFTGEKLDND